MAFWSVFNLYSTTYSTFVALLKPMLQLSFMDSEATRQLKKTVVTKDVCDTPISIHFLFTSLFLNLKHRWTLEYR